MILYLLTDGCSSRITCLLREKLGVSYSVSSSNYSNEKYGLMNIEMIINNDTIFNTLEEILKELNNIRKNGIMLNELNKAKKREQTNKLFSMNNSYDYAYNYGINLLYDNPLNKLNKQISDIEKITLDDVNSVITEIFNNKNIMIFTIGSIDDDLSDKINELIINTFN